MIASQIRFCWAMMGTPRANLINIFKKLSMLFSLVFFFLKLSHTVIWIPEMKPQKTGVLFPESLEIS